MSKIETWNLNDMFGISKEEDALKEIETIEELKQFKKELNISELVPFRNHPFKLYDGDRLNDIVASIKEYGIITPLIVRPLESGKYEILSGHNRANAGKIAGLEKAPVVIKEDLTDEEAMLIVTETNLIQRSLSELTHSEKARILTERHEAEKRWGKNSSKINEIERLSNLDGYEEGLSFGQIDQNKNTREKVANEYDLSPRNVARYLRIDMLINELKIRLDNKKEIPFIAGVDLSYLNEEEQNNVENLLNECGYEVDLKKANELKRLSRNRNLTYDKIKDILSGQYFKKKKSKNTRKLSANFNKKIIGKFTNEEIDIKDIEELILKLVDEYLGIVEENEDNQEEDIL